MLLDYLTAAAVADELRARVVGARVQEVLHLDRLTIAFELYAEARWYLAVSADSRREGFLLGRDRLRRGGGSPTPLALAARARLVGARLRAVDQPEHERILTLRFTGAAEASLVAELMGRMSNLALLDGEEVIVAVARPVTPAMTSARVVLPGAGYRPPPAPHKLPPDQLTAGHLVEWFSENADRPAWRILTEHLRAVSPLAAREAVARSERARGTRRRAPDGSADGDRSGEGASAGRGEGMAHDVDPEALADALAELFALPGSDDWETGYSLDESRVTAYAPYRLWHLPGWQATDSIFAAMLAYQSAAAGTDAYEPARDDVRRLVGQARERAQRRRDALERERPDGSDLEQERTKGDWILALQARIRPGQTSLAVDMGGDGPDLTIALDPALSPVENARRYYRRYRRARRAAEELPSLIAEVDAVLSTLDQLEADLELAEDRIAIDGVHDCLLAVAPTRSGGRARLKERQGRQPLRLVSSDGFTILVGRNSRENEAVTFEHAKRGDLWLHVRDAPGGHVVVKAAGRPVPERTRLEAAALAAHFSRARGERSAAVAVADVRHVRRLPGGGPGMVSYDHDGTLVVAPRPPDDL